MENLILKSVRFNAFVIKVLSLFAVIIFSSCNGGDGIVKSKCPRVWLFRRLPCANVSSVLEIK